MQFKLGFILQIRSKYIYIYIYAYAKKKRKEGRENKHNQRGGVNREGRLFGLKSG